MNKAPRLTELRLTDYKGFAGDVSLRLAPLTILLGKNNAGKSALCRSAYFATRGLLPSSGSEPFQLDVDGLNFGTSLLQVVHREQFSGLKFELHFDDAPSLRLDATAIPEQNYHQQIEYARVGPAEQPLFEAKRPSWETIKREAARFEHLAAFASRIDLLVEIRRLIDVTERWPGSPPTRVGVYGEDTIHVIADAMARRDDQSLEAMNEWFGRVMRLRVVVEKVGRQLELYAERSPAGSKVPFAQVGAGLRQVLPLVTALNVLQPKDHPRLLAVEHPELHIHPGAHGEIAELFLDALVRFPDRWFIVETHSDPFVLRLRAAIAQERLKAADLRMYFVEEAENGSSLKEIPFDDRGTPGWWPTGVFAEPQEEFLLIRRSLAERDRKK